MKTVCMNNIYDPFRLDLIRPTYLWVGCCYYYCYRYLRVIGADLSLVGALLLIIPVTVKIASAGSHRSIYSLQTLHRRER